MLRNKSNVILGRFICNYISDIHLKDSYIRRVLIHLQPSKTRSDFRRSARVIQLENQRTDFHNTWIMENYTAIISFILIFVKMQTLHEDLHDFLNVFP
jgi:hypothetical protein